MKNKIHKQGANKGESYQIVSLCVFPYTFRKRYTREEITTFSCNGCEKLKRSVIATARIDKNNDWFLLTNSTNHLCDHQKAIENNITNNMPTNNVSEGNLNVIANSSKESTGDENEIHPNEIPHEFIVNNKIHKQGLKKGESYQTVSLCVFPYMFRKRSTRKGNTTFSCNGCEKLKKSVLASARIDENKDWFLLTCHLNHICSPSATAHQKAEFSLKLYKKIAENPRASLPKLYYELKTSMTKDMDPETKKSYLKRISSFRNLCRGLYTFRSQFISRNPDSMKERDLNMVPKYTCDDCKTPFKKKHSLELHMNSVHLNYRPYLCNLCKKSFFIKSQLKMHMETTHKVKTK